MKAISISDEKVWIKYALVIPFFIASYILINYLPINRHIIPLTELETKIPFITWSIFIYISAIIQPILLCYYIPKNKIIPVFKSIYMIYIISFIFFILWPIQYPRELFSENPTVLFSLTYLIDNVGNCFPSLHVSLVSFITYAYYILNNQKSRLLDFAIITWSVLIIISVLTTKQHYLYDVFGGLALAALFGFFLKRYYSISK